MRQLNINLNTAKRITRFAIVLMLCIHHLSAQTETFKTLEYKDLSYLPKEMVANDSLQRLNLVVPDSQDKHPLFIWIGGGAWSYGDRNQEMGLANQFAKRGIAVASIGHRLSPATWRDPTLNNGIQHPKHIEDVAASVKWLYDNADEYNYDREHFFIGGFSSGGHLAALIALDPSYLKAVDLSLDVFKGIVPISGTYDVVNYHEVFANGRTPELAKLHVEAVFGPTREGFIEASPTTYLKNLSTPMLLMSDNAVDRYTHLFEESIRATGFKNLQVIYAEDLAHADLWRNISFSEKSIYRDSIIAFIKAHIKKG